MKKTRCVLIIICGILFSGCRDTDWCTVITKNISETDLYDAKIIGWSGVRTIGGNFGGSIPVPDEITITWKSTKQGKEKEAKEHLVKIDEAVKEYMDKYLKDKSTPYPEYESFPPALFEDHKVILVLKDKVPKRPKNGEILITYTGNENFEIKCLEKPINSDP